MYRRLFLDPFGKSPRSGEEKLIPGQLVCVCVDLRAVNWVLITSYIGVPEIQVSTRLLNSISLYGTRAKDWRAIEIQRTPELTGTLVKSKISVGCEICVCIISEKLVAGQLVSLEQRVAVQSGAGGAEMASIKSPSSGIGAVGKEICLLIPPFPVVAGHEPGPGEPDVILRLIVEEGKRMDKRCR